MEAGSIGTNRREASMTRFPGHRVRKDGIRLWQAGRVARREDTAARRATRVAREGVMLWSPRGRRGNGRCRSTAGPMKNGKYTTGNACLALPDPVMGFPIPRAVPQFPLPYISR